MVLERKSIPKREIAKKKTVLQDAPYSKPSISLDMERRRSSYLCAARQSALPSVSRLFDGTLKGEVVEGADVVQRNPACVSLRIPINPIGQQALTCSMIFGHWTFARLDVKVRENASRGMSFMVQRSRSMVSDRSPLNKARERREKEPITGTIYNHSIRAI